MFDLRPSGSSHWTKCHAYPRFCASVPEQLPSDPAREGTCAAWVAECVLRGEVPAAADMIDESHENGWLIDAEMADHIQQYCDHVRSYGGEIHVERKVRLNKMIAGTPDSYAIARPNSNGSFDLIVDDLKYGYDIVDPYRNTQISIYAGAILRMLIAKGVKIRKVVIGVYQPRSFHPQGIHRTWEVWPEILMAFVREIEQHGEECQDLNAPATPGFHCDHCEAASTCAALAHSIYKGFRVINDERQCSLTAKELADEMDLVNMMTTLVKARKNALDTEAAARMRRSEHIPTYGFEEQLGKRKFSVSPLQVILATGVSDVYDKPKLCTPAELQRRGADPEKIAEIAYRPKLPPKLTKLSADHFDREFGDRAKNLEIPKKPT